MKHLLSIILIISVLISCKSKQEQTKPIVETISESVYASGVVKSKNQYQVYATVNGIVKEKLVNEGDLVKVGTPILRVLNESSKLSAENAQLAANLANANQDKLNELKANIEFARIKMKNDSVLAARQKILWSQQVGSLNELEQRDLVYKNSSTTYDIALLRYNDTKKQLNAAAQQSNNNLQISTSLQNDFTIKSETDGRIYTILKEKGEIVNPASPVAVIGSADDFLLELQVDENDITKIRKGQKIVLTLNSYKKQVFEAKVDKINTIMNERSRSFTVEASFIAKPPTLYPNLTTEANIIIHSNEKALTIPRSYLVDDTFVLNKNNERVKVVVGLKDYQKVEIVSGITAEDTILKPEK